MRYLTFIILLTTACTPYARCMNRMWTLEPRTYAAELLEGCAPLTDVEWDVCKQRFDYWWFRNGGRETTAFDACHTQRGAPDFVTAQDFEKERRK